MSVEQFGRMPDGTIIERATITGGGLTARILSFGAVLQDLRLDGHAMPLVLGFEECAPYLTQSPYFGATVGRCANRIGNGAFELDGNRYEVDRNFLGKHQLHGGVDGISQQVWSIDDVQENAVHMSLSLSDGEMGFPGNVSIQLVYALLDDGVFDIVMRAKTDAPTLCNLAHHSYFNLDGSPTILDHMLQIEAEHFTATDDELIPTGELVAVEGHPFDFRQPKRIGAATGAQTIDTNFCVEDGAGTLRKVACLSSPASGVEMDVLTTEPGIQAYDGFYVDCEHLGLGGVVMKANSGFCLEPQIWPDAIHHPHFPQAVLRPDDDYYQRTQYAFRKR